MLSRYGNYFKSLPDPPCSRSSRLCLFSPRRLSGAAAGQFRVASPKASIPRVTLGGRCSARHGARGSRSRAPRGGSFVSLQRAALRARTATPHRLLETWLRRCAGVRRVRSALFLRLCFRSAIATISASVSPSPLDCSASDMRPRSAAHPAWDAERSRISSVARFRQAQRGFRAL